MTKRTMVLLVVVEERDSDFPTYDTDGAELEETSRVVPALPKRVLAKCGADLMQLAKRVAR
jgi:hypothetical protein